MGYIESATVCSLLRLYPHGQRVAFGIISVVCVFHVVSVRIMGMNFYLKPWKNYLGLSAAKIIVLCLIVNKVIDRLKGETGI